MSFRSAFSRMAFVASLCLAVTGVAKADVTWIVSGVFDDGGDLSGQFTIDQYGYLVNYNLQTTVGSSLPGFDYTPSDSYYATGTFYIDAQPGYEADLHLVFTNTLDIGSLNNTIIGGSPGPSYECENSYSCYVPSGGDTRYLAIGVANAVPELSTWAMMGIGFAGLGFAGYRRAKKNTATFVSA